MIKLRKAGMIAALTCAFGLPFAPLAHAGSGGFSPYPSQQLPTTQELQTPNYLAFAPSSHHLFAQAAKPHWPRLAPLEQELAQNGTGKTGTTSQAGS